MADKPKTTVQLSPDDYVWLWGERRPGESMKRAFSRLRGELVVLRGGGVG